MSGDDGLPRPPPDLDRREPVIAVLPAGTVLHRFYSRQYDPFNFDRSANARFNAGDESFGVMYTAVERGGAFAETFLRNVGSTAISEGFVRSKAYAALPLLRPLRAVRLRGYGLAPIGATASICSSPSYDAPQLWSRALYAHPRHLDAILYGSRHDDDQLCLAVFDRAKDAFGEPAIECNLLDTEWFLDLMDLYGLGLLPADDTGDTGVT
jgi:hypothetical protein